MELSESVSDRLHVSRLAEAKNSGTLDVRSAVTIFLLSDTFVLPISKILEPNKPHPEF